MSADPAAKLSSSARLNWEPFYHHSKVSEIPWCLEIQKSWSWRRHTELVWVSRFKMTVISIKIHKLISIMLAGSSEHLRRQTEKNSSSLWYNFISVCFQMHFKCFKNSPAQITIYPRESQFYSAIRSILFFEQAPVSYPCRTNLQVSFRNLVSRKIHSANNFSFGMSNF